MTQLPADELGVLPHNFVDPVTPHGMKQHWKMLEFGNKKNSTGTYREFYESLPLLLSYTCIDWNGKDGALPLDCNEPLPLQGGYDVITNFGFSEHVSNQESFWRNHHNMCVEGGYMCGVTPAPEENHWPHHGILQPTIKFYEELAKLNRYAASIWQNTDRKRYTNCYRYRKEHNDPFVWDDGLLAYITPTQNPSDQALRNSGL